MDVSIASIEVPSSHRATNSGKVKVLAESIREIGLMQPIGLTEDKRLIFGRHRLEAFVYLGRTHIPAIIHKLDKLKAELAEIDENIYRHNLSAVQEAKALARRKVLYEAIHPETKPVTERGGPGRGKKTTEKISTVSFADDTASRTGKTSRTVRSAVELGNKISDAAAVQLHGTKLADNKSELKKLAELDEDTQFAVAKKIADGEAKTVDQATGKTTPRTVKQKSCISEVKKLVREWLKTQTDKKAAKVIMAANLRDFAESLLESG